MTKATTIQVSVPHPCTQNWDEMTPNAMGRHCDHCRETVIDFTTWDDTALYNFLSTNSTPVCGRYFDTQLNRTWYSDRFALRLSGLMGFGTELSILGICAMTDNLFQYLLLNVFVLNGVWLISILYKKFLLAPNLK